MQDQTKKILLLGSGLMSGAVLDYLLKREENVITVASNILPDAEKLCLTRKRCSARLLDIQDEAKLRELIREHDIVLSMIPAVLQKYLAKPCLLEKKNLVTSSYTKTEMLELEEEIKKNNLIFLNECGLDPGIDHMTAMKIIDETNAAGGKVLEFESFCGGLVSPEFCDNPYGYKFSWSPIGALRSLKNDAVFLQDGERKTIPKEDLLFESKKKEISMALNLEGYPNRDSLGYKDLYFLKDVQTLIRGTLRYGGFTLLARSLIELGLLEEDPIADKHKADNWREFMSKLIADQETKSVVIDEKIVDKLFNKINIAKEDQSLYVQILNKIFKNSHYKNSSSDTLEAYAHQVLKAFKWTGYLDANAKRTGNSYIESTTALLETKLSLKPGEKDLVVLQHRFVIENADKSKEVKTSSIIKIGEKDLSAMAVCVGYTVAIGTQLVLDKVITKTGVIIPNTKDIYEPMLQLLAKEGVYAREESE